MECDYIQAKSSNWSKQGQYGMRRRCNGSTYPLRVQVGRNEVSMEWADHEMRLRTAWGCKLVAKASVWNEQKMEWQYIHTKSSNWSKRGPEYGMNSRWNVITYGLRVETRSVWNESPCTLITHKLRVQISRNDVSTESTARGMWLRTSWEFKLVEMMSVSNEHLMEWHYIPTESSKWPEPRQY